MFASFGVLIGLLFGFFGMGGSFLVTPALLVMGYRPDVAVASGLAFVFGTSVIATLKHRDLGQVDYKLGVLMIAGTTAGIEVGKIGLHWLQHIGLADTVVSVAYVALLGGIGVFITYAAVRGEGGGGVSHDQGDGEIDADDIPDIAKKIQSYRIPPMMTLRGGIQVSLWMVLFVAFVTGLLSGFLGVGGGFIRMPALFYLIGVPVPVAVGTDLFEIVFSGGIGSFLYAMDGAVNLSIVVPLLAGMWRLDLPAESWSEMLWIARSPSMRGGTWKDSGTSGWGRTMEVSTTRRKTCEAKASAISTWRSPTAA